jgi:histidine ammonia-lyase
VPAAVATRRSPLIDHSVARLQFPIMSIVLDGHCLTLEQLAAIADLRETVTLDPSARSRVAAARSVVDTKAAGEEVVYGINTGFGSLADVRIPRDALDALQINLLRSHAAGVGDPLPARTVRAIMALRANVLAYGCSGIRLETLDALMALLNGHVIPLVPSRGSVGASGDLAPLAHLALVLVGEGYAAGPSGPVPGEEALRAAGLRPVRLEAKEGLALVNGTQPSTAVLALALLDAERLARAADIAAALSIDGLRGSTRPFDARIHAARPHDGQRVAASNMAALLAGSAINASHADCGRVQDAYSMRCAAQVHGAARDGLAFVRRTLEVEVNAATDNPMVFAETGEMISGGNFHGAPVAVAADLLAIAVVQLATISERRSDRLVNPASSGLPPFLTRNGGVESGLMMAQVTAAALTSELKVLAHPSSADSIPTSGNREDHVSMSMAAALKAERVVALARQIVAIELLCAAQALDLLAPLRTSAPLSAVHEIIRAHVPTLDGDRPPASDIVTIDALVASGALDHLSGVVVK